MHDGSALNLGVVSWSPGRRRAQRALESPFENVPDHLAQPLMDWIQDGFTGDFEYHADRLRDVALELRISLPAGPHNQVGAIMRACRDDEEFLLDVVETLLELYDWDRGRASTLADLLIAGNSAYRVKKDWDGLEVRVTEGVRAAVQETVDEAEGSSGEHLATAWNSAYGRSSDPVKSYSESIKAVEAALAPVVSPTNLRATLGTLIGEVRNKPESFALAIEDGQHSDGVGTVVGLMRVLWEGQTSRHGGVTPTRHETVQEAQAAVHIAATLVQWATSGAFNRR